MAYVLFNTDAITALKAMEAESVNCCVTSPPYWGLRDYKLEPLVWGGVEGCEHEWGEDQVLRGPAQSQGATSQRKGRANVEEQKTRGISQGCWCSLCGAWRGSLGLEPTPELYVQHLVEIFREVRRVLRPDGTLWLNLGDSYARDAAKGQHKPGDSGKQAYIYDNGGGRASAMLHLQSESKGSSGGDGLKPKDLIGIPWRVAFALQADGWWLRSDIVWHKPNPMPGSQRDRCTTAHEYVFMLAKSERYYHNWEAIAEPTVGNNQHDLTGMGYSAPGQIPQKGNRKGSGNLKRKLAGQNGGDRLGTHMGSSIPYEYKDGSTRTKRDVWNIATAPYKGAHFATFPPALVEPCILAGCPPGGIVLDPFAGSGTALMVAQRLGRDSIGVEPNPEYCRMAEERVAKGK